MERLNWSLQNQNNTPSAKAICLKTVDNCPEYILGFEEQWNSQVT